MNRLTKVLLGMLAGVFFFGVASIGLTWSVSYKPYGVPDHLRQRYDQTIAELEQQQKQARAPGAKPRVRVAKTLHDFGMMDPHDTAKYAFEVANIGESPLELHVMDSSCKCTIGKLLQPYVAPGETTQVTLTWNTGYQADEYQQTVLLSTNDPNRKTIELSVKGTVRSELVVPGAIAFAKSDLMKETSSEFYVYSQLWDEFVVTDASSQLNDFHWYAEPADVNDPRFSESRPKSAWKVTCWTRCHKLGDYNGEIDVTITPSDTGVPVVRTVKANGRVRSPINFYSPEIHVTEGLDLGTIVSDQQHEFHLIVRARGQQDRSIEVLNCEPKEIQTNLEPLPKAGTYRLSIIVPQDCPLVIFNGDHQHGFVQVGDPEDARFSNWFPLRGAVVQPK